MQRLVFLDIAKAICIILVVIGHYHPDNSPEWYNVIWKFIYSFHMPLFMFASGYIYIATKREHETYKGFIGKKVKRLMVPYLVTSFLIITLKLITQGNAYVANPVTLSSYAKMFYLPEAGYFLWFIWALWWMFVVVPLFRTPKSRLALFLISIVLAYLPLHLTDLFCINQFKGMFVYFMLGVIAFERKDCISRIKMHPLVVYLSFVVVECLCLFNIGGGILSILNEIVPFIGIAAVLQLSVQMESWVKSDKPNWILQISVSSYIIYLFHTTFEGFAKAVLHKIPGVWNTGNDWVFCLTAIIVIVVGVVFPVLLHKYILQKYRITRLLFGLK